MAVKEIIFKHLDELFTGTPNIKLTRKSRLIIFSDLHLGNGKRRKDDFLHNSVMFFNVLEEYYYRNGYTLILNGDIEDLQKFNSHAIKKAWSAFYRMAEKFHNEKRLIKIMGNHEQGLSALPDSPINNDVPDACILRFRKESIFIFHGHQAIEMFNKHQRIISLFLRFLVAPLGIRNRTASHDSKRKYEVERMAYGYSSEKKIVSILGHTHRPLFESFSKYDALRFSMERHLRDFPGKNKKEQKKVREEIRQLKKELESLTEKEKDPRQSFYHEYLIYPCLFNSGCVIGKRGMTGIEIEGNTISLVHWYDAARRKKSWKEEDSVYVLRHKFHKRILNSDNLEYIFNRIHLLGDD
ncbi:MAG: metallophosphoesterase [Spirochaetales bacterium]|nr:metallophosphoesterase [Spirochaetales bacterium]